MKYYIDENNEIHQFKSDGSQDFLITKDMKPYKQPLLKEDGTVNKLSNEKHLLMLQEDGTEFKYYKQQLNAEGKHDGDIERIQSELDIETQLGVNKQHQVFLDSTDWKVIRHKDQTDLGIPTSLTDEEYTQLLTDRQTARDAIVQIQE